MRFKVKLIMRVKIMKKLDCLSKILGSPKIAYQTHKNMRFWIAFLCTLEYLPKSKRNLIKFFYDFLIYNTNKYFTSNDVQPPIKISSWSTE